VVLAQFAYVYLFQYFINVQTQIWVLSYMCMHNKLVVVINVNYILSLLNCTAIYLQSAISNFIYKWIHVMHKNFISLFCIYLFITSQVLRICSRSHSLFSYKVYWKKVPWLDLNLQPSLWDSTYRSDVCISAPETYIQTLNVRLRGTYMQLLP